METGAQRNELPDALYELSDMYERQARANQGRLESLLVPAMVVAVGGVVGLIILALFFPMVGLLQAVSQ
jgi:type IV pilus assembly protein PilC